MEAVAGTTAGPVAAWRRSWLLDAAPVAAVVALGGVLDISEQREHGGVASAVLAFAVAWPLLFRRRHPLVVFAAVTTLVVAAAHALPYPCIAAALVACYSVAAYDPRWRLSLGAVLVVIVVVGIAFPGPLPPIPDALGPLLLLVTPWLAGNGMRLRQRRVESVESRALRLEGERDEAERALREERSRIARELHDVVAHSVSVMVVQAGAARQVLRSKPDRATEALLAVEESGRDAMDELRHLLGLLTDTAEVPLAPQPGLDALPTLVERMRAAGLPVALRVEGAPRRLPPGVDLAAYRVAQEALTNALRHAAAAATEVIVEYGSGDVRIEILDEGPAVTAPRAAAAGRGGGQGLVGMRERVALYGGSLDAGPRPGGGYAVRARLPAAVE